MYPDFERLTLRERAILLRERGTAITRRRHRHYFITLCALDGDYIELWYHTFEKRIERIEIIREAETLDIYLSQIQLSGVHEMLHDPETREKYIAEANKRQQLREETVPAQGDYQHSGKPALPEASTVNPGARQNYFHKKPERFEPVFKAFNSYLVTFVIYVVLFIASLAFRDAFGGSKEYGSEGYDKYCRESLNQSTGNSGKESLSLWFSNVKVSEDSLK